MGYSNIISAENYNDIISNQHRYVFLADAEILIEIYKFAKKSSKPVLNILEIGSGPGRLSDKIYRSLDDSGKKFKYTLLDSDKVFIKFAKQSLKTYKRYLQNKIVFESKDINRFKLNCKKESNSNVEFDIIVSQGSHHHLNMEYLQNVKKLLSPNGIFIISDEFIPEYNNELERGIKLTIWYQHIIRSAIDKGFNQLAIEEIKTYLDDLCTNKKHNYKDINLIKFVFNLFKKLDSPISDNVALELFRNIQHKDLKYKSKKNISDELSRGDLKISLNILSNQLLNFGLKIKNVTEFGEIKIFGALVVISCEHI